MIQIKYVWLWNIKNVGSTKNNTMTQYYKENSVGKLLAEIDLSDLELAEGLNFSSFIKTKGRKID